MRQLNFLHHLTNCRYIPEFHPRQAQSLTRLLLRHRQPVLRLKWLP
jgi:hypothetical protein